MGSPSTPNSTMTIKTDSPAKYGIDTKGPGLPPDLTEKALRDARNRELARLLGSRGRRSTFLGAGESGGLGANFWAKAKGTTALGGQ